MTEEVIIEAPKQVFYIKLASEADMPTAFSWAYKQDSHKEVDEEGNETVVLDGDPYLVAYTRDYSIDLIGVMHEPTGTMLTDDEGNEYPEMAAIDGWHVNVKINRAIPNKDAEDPEAVDTLRDIIEALDASSGVNPNSPSRGWL